ncbi:FGGY-family carbohydrate kinase [Pararhizobium mangrovi]|uniref:Carbohydrate kinase n=1 Tax=Pararhizobium mangrovi TaxID=2590452 RepID=A0A506UB29_9HYPH|nr:FGGY-family carbohydrate kinase [Pararhizobium mangrovi]TPW30254.1 carbohydrate kinase [Pararhizobium mangrovi]
MAPARHVAVVDIGKTNAKMALVDLMTTSEIAVRRQPNRVLQGPPYPHYDIEALWAFILAGLREFQAQHGVDAITVTTHGACAALLDAGGDLAAPVLDYEHDGPDTLSMRYNPIRPAFTETGTPRLPLGLNLGAQLFWQFETFPWIRQRTRTILTYPQYWTYRLCGVASNEVTSLGCHTDLWNPHEGAFSSLVERMGWGGLMAPVRKATEQLGTLEPAIAAQTGVPEGTPVVCGIHDSNASLYPHLAAGDPPFAVVSTGTWVICMAVGGKAVSLDPSRDTLINVNAFGNPVPSARFMGGREFERLMEGRRRDCTAADVDAVLKGGAMLLPAVENGSGPFQGRRPEWTVDEASLPDGERYAAVSCYLAMMTATCLEMVGAAGSTIVEGPFAMNAVYRNVLAAATKRPVVAVEGTGTSIGAAMMIDAHAGRARPARAERTDPHRRFFRYVERWREALVG